MKRRECHPDTTITYPPLSSSTSCLPLSLLPFFPSFSLFPPFFFFFLFNISILPPTYTFPYLYRPLLCDSFLFLQRKGPSPSRIPSFVPSPTSLSFPVSGSAEFRGFLARFVSFELEKRQRERKKKIENFSRYAINKERKRERERKEEKKEKKKNHRFHRPSFHSRIIVAPCT